MNQVAKNEGLTLVPEAENRTSAVCASTKGDVNYCRKLRPDAIQPVDACRQHIAGREFLPMVPAGCYCCFLPHPELLPGAIQRLVATTHPTALPQA